MYEKSLSDISKFKMYEKMFKSQTEGCLRGEVGVEGQILHFGYFCAQFYCPLPDGSKNLQF